MIAETAVAINEFHSNCWLQQRGQLPRHRTTSKARRAALAAAYQLLDPLSVGGVEEADMILILRALGFKPAVVSAVLESAKPDENGLLPAAEFTRLCLEAEQRARKRVSSFESPRSASESFPLSLLMERHRIVRANRRWPTAPRAHAQARAKHAQPPQPATQKAQPAAHAQADA
jgi:hypothetical protein